MDFPFAGPANTQRWSVQFEAQRVEMVLDHFGLREHLPALVGDHERQHSERRLTFESFQRLFPSFPVVLAARWRPRVEEHCPLADLFRRTEQTFLLEDYLEVHSRHAEQAQGRPVGLVLPFGGFRGGVVVHDGVLDTRITRILHDIRGDLPPHRVTVEPFLPFLRFLARGGWTPDSPLPDRRQTHGAKVRAAARLHPWMVQAVGAGPALIVLAWLVGVLRSRSGYHRRYVQRLSGGERRVQATHEQIAAATGLSARQTKRGMATLRHLGLVTTSMELGHSFIVLDWQAIRLIQRQASN